jgi:hypothetical protein
MTAAHAKPAATKNMNLGVDTSLVAKSIAAAKEVARETGIPTNVYPQNVQLPQTTPIAAAPATTIPAPLPATDKKTRGARPAPVRRYSVDLPLYVIHEIHEDAFKRGITKKRVFLEILKAGGLKVKDVDILESGEVLKGDING